MGAAEWMRDLLNTKRPLEEKMALFWHQVFATGVSKVDHRSRLPRPMFNDQNPIFFKEPKNNG